MEVMGFMLESTVNIGSKIINATNGMEVLT